MYMDIGSLASMGQSLMGGAESDKKAANAVSSMIPDEILNKLPPAVRTVTASKAAAEVAKQAPEIYEVLKKGGKLTGSDAEKLKAIVMRVVNNSLK